MMTDRSKQQMKEDIEALPKYKLSMPSGRADDVAQGDVNSLAKGSGARRNAGKIALSLVPFHLLAGCCRVFMGGKIKYAEWNWAKGMAWSSCFDCALRHLFKWWYCGEDIDPESGEHHLDHVFCNLFMLRHYVDNHPDGDDRPPAYVEFAKSMDDFSRKFDEDDFKKRTGYATPRAATKFEDLIDPLGTVKDKLKAEKERDEVYEPETTGAIQRAYNERVARRAVEGVGHATPDEVTSVEDLIDSDKVKAEHKSELRRLQEEFAKVEKRKALEEAKSIKQAEEK